MLYIAMYAEPSGPDSKVKYCTESRNEHVAYNAFLNYTKVEPTSLYENSKDSIEPLYKQIDISKIIRIVKRSL